MARSIKKGPYVAHYLQTKIEKMISEGKRDVVKTFSRRSVVIPSFIGFTFQVYNGKTFIPVYITENMVGHKLGEFSFTRRFPGHTQNK